MNRRIIFRLPDEMYEDIQKLMKSGRYETISQVVREALKQFLEAPPHENR